MATAEEGPWKAPEMKALKEGGFRSGARSHECMRFPEHKLSKIDTKGQCREGERKRGETTDPKSKISPPGMWIPILLVDPFQKP